MAFYCAEIITYTSETIACTDEIAAYSSEIASYTTEMTADSTETTTYSSEMVNTKMKAYKAGFTTVFKGTKKTYRNYLVVLEKFIYLFH
jgi:hypothetical protein